LNLSLGRDPPQAFLSLAGKSSETPTVRQHLLPEVRPEGALALVVFDNMKHDRAEETASLVSRDLYRKNAWNVAPTRPDIQTVRRSAPI